MVAEVGLIEVWKALNLGTSLTGLFEKVQSSTRAGNQNRTALPNRQSIKISFVQYKKKEIFRNIQKCLIDLPFLL